MNTYDVWSLIAENTEPDPILYTRAAHICRTSRAVFFNDALWAKFSPTACTRQLAQKYHLRMAQKPRDLLQTYLLIANELYSTLMSELDVDSGEEFDLVKIKLIKAEMHTKKMVEDPDLRLMSLYWAHLNSYVWWTADVRRSNSHRDMVASHGLFKRREFILAAVRLHGPLLRYAPQEYLDDEEIVLAAANCYAPKREYDFSDELVRWKFLPPYELISDRLKAQRHVTMAFINRWPVLAQHAPLELLGMEGLLGSSVPEEYIRYHRPERGAVCTRSQVQNADAPK